MDMYASLRIRPAASVDLAKIREIYADARRFMAENGNPHQWGDSYPSNEIIAEDLQRQQLYVCLCEDTIVGVFCGFWGEEPDYLEIFDGNWLDDAPYAVVHRLATSARQRGIAAFCLNYALQRWGNVRIDTHADNLPMQKALSKNGFSRCGIVHCSHGGDRIAYQKIQDRFV